MTGDCLAEPCLMRKELSLKQNTSKFHFTGNTANSLKKDYLACLHFLQGALPQAATSNDHYLALAFAVRARMLQNWLENTDDQLSRNNRAVCYLSAEYLPGSHLGNALVNLGIMDQARSAMKECGQDLDVLLGQEQEPGLGNGGLGRLAACFLDSMANLNIPCIGYGIRYEFGIFDQEIKDGWQVEKTDKWLSNGNPWEICHPGSSVEVKLGGYTRNYTDASGHYRVQWVPERIICGVPYNTLIPGYKTLAMSTMRLWKAEACESFDVQAFNTGDYLGAVHEKIVSETISKILYPNEGGHLGKKLRLAQQFFFVSCSLQDLIRIQLLRGRGLETFHTNFAVQLNDTHPSIAIAELMRLLVDENGMEWEKAWDITRQTFSYTNHTLLPEALEIWPVALFADLLPRHLEIIYEINARFLSEVRQRFPHDEERVRRLSLIEENGERSVRMAHLATVGSYAVNGVSRVHTALLKKNVLKDFHALWPEKIVNITNGIAQRRWLLLSNPRLSALITEVIGKGWIRNSEELRKLEPLVGDSEFKKKWREVKNKAKVEFAGYVRKHCGLIADSATLFDVQAKRIHEYKRQHLNVLHIIALYLRIKQNPAYDIAPRTFIFAGKAAPGYSMAKLIIKLINEVAFKINNDPDVNEKLKVAFIPDFNITVGQRIYPAADLSEQISTAGKEASGTGNMKFMLNGALTIGTMDGANIEIQSEVGVENFFCFGLKVTEVEKIKKQGYQPRDSINSCPELNLVLESLARGDFSPDDKNLFRPLLDDLLERDSFFVLADFDDYIACQEKISKLFLNQDEWTRRSILNTARSGFFSSDRSIREYAEKIWKVKPSTDL